MNLAISVMAGAERASRIAGAALSKIHAPRFAPETE
jgi:streptomycin 6-kinase